MDSTIQLSLEELKTKITQLPSLPSVVTKVLQIINHPKTSAEDVSKYIENDIALSSMVLKLANSAYYGIPQTISSVRTAIVILGFNSIKTLVIPASMAKVFPDRSNIPGFNLESFWVHAVETAVFSRALSQHIKGDLDREQMFTAGLLHDVGRLILMQLNELAFEKIVSQVVAGSTWDEAEQNILGVKAVEAGDVLFESWNFPDNIREPVRCHQHPETAGRSVQAAWIVNLAHRLSIYKGTVTVSGEDRPDDFSDVFKVLGLTGSVEEWLEKLSLELEKASAFLELFKGK